MRKGPIQCINTPKFIKLSMILNSPNLKSKLVGVIYI